MRRKEISQIRLPSQFAHDLGDGQLSLSRFLSDMMRL